MAVEISQSATLRLVGLNWPSRGGVARDRRPRGCQVVSDGVFGFDDGRGIRFRPRLKSVCRSAADEHAFRLEGCLGEVIFT